VSALLARTRTCTEQLYSNSEQAHSTRPALMSALATSPHIQAHLPGALHWASAHVGWPPPHVCQRPSLKQQPPTDPAHVCDVCFMCECAHTRAGACVCVFVCVCVCVCAYFKSLFSNLPTDPAFYVLLANAATEIQLPMCNLLRNCMLCRTQPLHPLQVDFDTARSQQALLT
jgi:hypothetical protein